MVFPVLIGSQESQLNGSWISLVSSSGRVPRKRLINRVALAEQAQAIGGAIDSDGGQKI